MSKKEINKILLYLILVVIIPATFIIIDKQNDISNSNLTPTDFSFTMNSTTSEYVVKMREFPPDTKFSVNISLRSAGIGRISVYGFGEGDYENYLAGVISLQDYSTNKIVHQETTPTWFNFSIETEGIVRLLFVSDSTDLVVTVDGTYYYEVTSYFLRNAIGIFVLMGTYLFVIFSFIPQLIKSVRKRRYQNRLRQQRMEEEKEFYDKYREEPKK